MSRLRIATGSVELGYVDAGGGLPPVVLLHGFPFDADLWRPQLAGLADRWRIIAPDFCGFGISPLSAEPYTLARLADDVAELLDRLGIGRAVIGGLSMGGYVGFEFYRRHADRVSALILADTRPAPDSPEARANRARMAERVRNEGVHVLTEQLLPQLLSPLTRNEQPQVERQLRAMMDSAAPVAIEHALSAMADREDSRPLLPEISVPTLVIGGADDQLTPPQEIREWSARIPGVELEFITGAGHVPNLEQPERFNELLARFLLRAGPASGPPRPALTRDKRSE